MKTIKEIHQIANQGPFHPTWESLNAYQIPQWFQKAKFGIFIHWGLYSIPAYNNEWYSRNMYIQSHPEFKHHIETYGPQKEFGYKDFIPLFTADKFNATDWLNLFKNAGAKYLFPVAEHHDGFQMYDSEISQYNALKMGPKRDILGELRDASEELGLHFCTSSHRAEHWFFFGHGQEFDSDVKEPMVKGDFYWPAMPEPDNQSLVSEPYPTTEFLDDWLLRTCEIIDKYQPEVLYFDWWIQHEAFKEYLKILTAYYYNRGAEWGRPTSITYKHDALMFGTGIVEIERGKFADAQPFYWQTDTAIARNSWCYTTTLDYKEPLEIIHDLIEVVSKNGNLLLNVGPKGNGEIPQKDREILETVGNWLTVNGEGIYESKVWRKSGEGTTQLISGQFQEAQVQQYNETDIRFTVRGEAIYAFLMNPSKQVVIHSLKESQNQNNPEFHSLIKTVEILGSKEQIVWEQTEAGLIFQLPDSMDTSLPIACKIILK